MKKIQLRTRRSLDELNLDLARAASSIKLVCGVANNATWLVMLDAHDQIKKHPNYRHQVKRLYKAAFEEFRKKEKALLHSRENRLFHLNDFSPEARKRYGDITDSQYFEYWQGLGAKAYTEGGKWVSCLANKYKISLDHHGVNHSEILSKVMVAEACLELAIGMYDSVLDACVRDYAVPRTLLDDIFGLLDLKSVSKIWKSAMFLTDPTMDDYDLEEVEEKNITQGIVQLHHAWSDPRMIYSSAFAATIDFDEIFRTKGENLKRQKEYERLIALSEKEMNNAK